MNSLVSKLENASLDEKNLNYQVGNLIEEIESVKVNDPESNWVELCINYANLNYLLKYIDEHDKSPKFMKTLKNILSELDIIHQKYLNEINWNSPLEYFEGILEKTIQFRYPDSFLEIKECFEKSLVQKNLITKLETICEAYSIFIQMLEDVKRQYVSLNVDIKFENKIKF